MSMIDSELFKNEIIKAISARKEFNTACDTARARERERERDEYGFIRAEAVMYEKGRLATNADLALAHAVIGAFYKQEQEQEQAAKAAAKAE